MVAQHKKQPVLPDEGTENPNGPANKKAYVDPRLTCWGNFEDIKSRAMDGEAEAQRLLALIYELGLSGEVDGSEAAEWYMRAALRGLVVAQFQLARLYVEGRGVPQDYVSGYVWMALAARAGHEPARTLMPMLARLMSNQELAEANERVAALRKTETKG